MPNLSTAMSKNPLKLSEDNLQLSILGFVDKPSNGSGVNRLPRATKDQKFIPAEVLLQLANHVNAKSAQ